MNNLSVHSINPTQGAPSPGAVNKTQGTGFGEIFNESMAAVNDKLQEAQQLGAGLVTGEHSNIHETMIAMEESGIALKLVAKVQSKVIEAYKEMMRLQL